MTAVVQDQPGWPEFGGGMDRVGVLMELCAPGTQLLFWMWQWWGDGRSVGVVAEYTV